MSLNDCFQAPETLLGLDAALDLLAARLSPVVPVESVDTFSAERRVLALDIVSSVVSPPFAASAMDGFAFRHADLAAHNPLKVTARIAAGHFHHGAFGPGEAAQIFTGAPVPDGLDTVVMQEDCVMDGDRLTVPATARAGSHVRPIGEDFGKGTVVLCKGRRLRPQDVSIAAGVGLADLPVHARLRVGVFSTGDEVIEPGHDLPPGAIYGTNRHGIAALCAGLGCVVEDLGNIPDSLDETVRRLDEASGRLDMLITSGGVSVGGEDHVRTAVERLGAIHLWRLALKPGKPVAFGHVNTVPFVGLPGYPVSALVTFMLVARPVILRLSGAIAESLRPQRFPVRAAFSFDKDKKRRQFLRASLQTADDGALEAVLFRTQESSVLSSMVNSDGLVDLAETLGQVRPGDSVPFIPYAVLQW